MTFGATTRSRLVLFGGLYFAQGVPWGLVTGALALKLGGQGLGPAQLGTIAATAYWPWTLKVFLGPLMDSLSAARGGRRTLLLASELAMALTVIALAVAEPRQQWLLFLGLVFTGSLFVAVQDVLTDSLAVAVLSPTERGRANGVMLAAKYAGTLAGTGGLTWLASHVGWPATHAAAAAMLLVPAAAVLVLREPPVTPAPLGPALRALVRQIPPSFLQRGTLMVALFVLVAGASDTFLSPLVMTRLRQGLELSERTMSALVSLAAGTTMAGCLLGGWLADRLGRRRTIVMGAVALALSHLAFGVAGATPATLVGYQIGAGVSAGVLYAATLALCMDFTNPQLPATHFQAFMALLSVRLMWASRLGGQLAENAPQMTMFVLAAAIELVPLVLLLSLGSRRTPRGELSSSA